MTMVNMPVDNSTLAITSIICAGLLFVFLLVAADEEFRKPPIAATIAIVVGGLLYWLGFIPVGLMMVAAFGLVIGIFKALSSNQRKTNARSKSYQPSYNNIKDDANGIIDSSSEAARPHNTIVIEKIPKPALSPQYKNDKIDHEFKIVLICLFVGFACWGFFEYKETNEVQTYSPIVTSGISTTAASAPDIPSQPIVSAPVEAPVNPALMQQCDSYATEHKRKESTLTYQEQREDYSKLYEYCVSEANKVTQTTSISAANNYNVEAANDGLLQAYQTVKIENETSRQNINKTWEDLIKTLPDNQKNNLLKLQRAWVKSKRNVCGKIEGIASNNASNLTSDELTVKIKILECDSQANSERAAVLLKIFEEQDAITKIITDGNK